MNVTPERWQQVARIYELAVGHDPSTRDSFVFELCAGDEVLLREVHSLLHQDEASVVLDWPLWATAAPLFQGDCDLRPGATLGPYRIGFSVPAVWEKSSRRLTRASIVALQSRFCLAESPWIRSSLIRSPAQALGDLSRMTGRRRDGQLRGRRPRVED